MNFIKDVWVWSIIFCRSMYSGWYLWTLHSFWCLVSVSSGLVVPLQLRVDIFRSFEIFLCFLIICFVHVLYYVDFNSTSFFSAAFCPFHIGQFTVILLSLEEAVSAWLIFSFSLCQLMPFILYLNHLNTSYGTFWGCTWLSVLYGILEPSRIFVCHARSGR